MRKTVFLFISCILICLGAYRWGDLRWKNVKIKAMEYLYVEVSQIFCPYVHTFGKKGKELLYEDVEKFFVPLVSEFRTTKYQAVMYEDIGQDTEENISMESGAAMNNKTEEEKEISTESVSVSGINSILEQKVVINRTKLQEFDYLRQNFYQVDNTTTIGKELLDVNKLLGKDMSVKEKVDGPQILIYHTHANEAYKDSVKGDASMSVVGVGDYLESLLESKYGIQVLHHKGEYDTPSRDNAYSKALPNLEKILQENPTIEVVIDLHRDGVPETRHFVTEINGKPTAQIMFFNGLSRTTAQGELTYLANPYLEDNLALSFQMQLAAAEYYPGFTRKIYLKGYRYNMHLCPKSMLIEVGAQTNTFEEAKNAMEPLADILALVLTENSSE